jgi:hypothetical protein
MYGTVQHEAWRQCPREMGQQLATIRLEKATRESGVKTPGLLRFLGWELARVAGSSTSASGTPQRRTPRPNHYRQKGTNDERYAIPCPARHALARWKNAENTDTARRQRSGNGAEGGSRVKA